MSMFWWLFLVAIFILLSGFFSGIETGFISLNRLLLKEKIDTQKEKKAIIINNLLSDLDRLIATTLIGTNFAVISATSIFTGFILQFIGKGEKWLTAVILFPIILLFGEIIPKSLFRQESNTILLTFAKPIRFFYLILSPIVIFITYISSFILKFFGQFKETYKSPFVTREELKYLILESAKQGVITSRERSMIYSIFDFGVTKVKETMMPIQKIVSLKIDSSIKDMKSIVKRTNFSRVPVYEQNPQKIIGMINIMDILFEVDENKNLKEFMRPLIFINKEMPIDELLLLLQKEKRQMAILMDEKDRNVGMITVEDLVEEIFGEIATGL